MAKNRIFVRSCEQPGLSGITNLVLMRALARLILKLMGWNIYTRVSIDYPKSVFIMAPHTSNMDFFVGRLAFYMYGVRPKILIKKEAFTPMMGPLLRWLGGVPVDRGSSQKTVKKVTEEFDRHKEFHLLITPEGTRQRVNKWKRGFYFIALQAKVPIFLGFLDYRRKEGGVGKMIIPSGDFDADFRIIEDFYRDKHARHPDKFNLSGTS